MDRKLSGRNIVGALVMFVALLVTVSASPAKPLPSQSAWQANAHQLGNRVLKAIHRLEKSELNCQTRNLLVHRLRLLHDAITSGRGTAARGFLIAWLHNVRTMQGAQLLSAEEGSALQVALMDMIEQVGEGWPKNPMPTRNWPRLPACYEASDGFEGINDWSPIELSDAQYIVKALAQEVPVVGKILGPLVQIYWPDNGPNISDMIDENIKDAARDNALSELDTIKGALDNFLMVVSYVPSQASGKWGEAQSYIAAGLEAFKWDHTASGGEDYRVLFLPIFAQAQNLYLALLREGVFHGTEWGWDSDEVNGWKTILKNEIDPEFVDSKTGRPSGMKYAMDIYNLGFSQQPTGMDQSDWTTRNSWSREYTLGVLDFVEVWKYMDLYAYPNGVPNIKLTRMIYSDPIGYNKDGITVPPYAYGPLRNLTVWVDEDAIYPFIEAMQQTGGPTAGPIETGPIMGDADLGYSPTRYDYDVAPGSHPGPIISVYGYASQYYPLYPKHRLCGLKFKFAGNQTTDLLGSRGWYYDHQPQTTSAYSFSYPGEVVADAQVMGEYDFQTYSFKRNRSGADCVVFGFRYADSYYPSGNLINSDTGGCMKPIEAGAFVVLGSSDDCGSGENIWTYNSALRQFSTQGFCLDTDNSGVAKLNPCKDTATQRWDIIPSGNGGTIGRNGLVLTPLQAPNAILYLTGDEGAANQRWVTPEHVQGPVHAVAAGMCLGSVSSPDNGTYMQIYPCASGFAPGQTWTYSPSMATLSLMGGTMCLDAPDDSEDNPAVAGTVVQVNVCNAEDSQQWILEPGTSRIQHVNSGLYLDLYEGNTVSSTSVVLWNDTDTHSQKWTWPMY